MLRVSPALEHTLMPTASPALEHTLMPSRTLWLQ
jgi:hypothetical protein